MINYIPKQYYHTLIIYQNVYNPIYNNKKILKNKNLKQIKEKKINKQSNIKPVNYKIAFKVLTNHQN